MLEIYEKVEGELLILGKLGSGKTTLLLDLALGLIERAERDESFGNRFQSWFARRLGVPSTLIYEQHHVHPHMTFASLDVFRLVQVVYPTSPTTCRQKVWLFTARGHRPGWMRKILGRLIAPVVTVVTRQIVFEDRAIYPDIQRGLEASRSRGVIGTREERVYVFQKYVLDRCGVPPSSVEPSLRQSRF